MHYRPVIKVRTSEITARYLSEDEWVCIADRRRAGHGVREIAEELGRSPSAISRNLRLNLDQPLARTGRSRSNARQSSAVSGRAGPSSSGMRGCAGSLLSG
jgi:IS30 family transposase